MTSQDLNSIFYHYHCEFDAAGLIQKYANEAAKPVEGGVVNFLGTVIPPAVNHKHLDGRVNTVEQPPIPSNWHADMAEWAAALKSVDEAVEVYRILEVGCGWGCWMTNMGVAARAAGLDVDLAGIDGVHQHLKKAHKTLNMNGFSDDQIQLINGVASSSGGKAVFPLYEGYGGEPVFNPSERQISDAEASETHVVLDCFTLSRLARGRLFDLVHIDIQGSELDFVRDNFTELQASSKRVLIGTHSREIEGGLMEHFLRHQWCLEMERPAILRFEHGKPKVKVDGVQMWRNPPSSTAM